MAEQPHVEVDPAVRFGAPHVRGRSTESLSSMYAVEDAETVCEEFGITRHELLVALWHEAQHGTFGERCTEWKAWADRVAPALGGHVPLDLDAIEWPPDRRENT